MSAVRLEPLITQANDPRLRVCARVALIRTVSKSGTSWSAVAHTICTGATIDAPRPPQPAVTKTEPVWAIRASAREMVACADSGGPPSDDQRVARSLAASE